MLGPCSRQDFVIELFASLKYSALIQIAILRLRRSICHMRGFIFTNARKIYYHLRVSIARFLITLQVTWTFNRYPAHNSYQKRIRTSIFLTIGR